MIILTSCSELLVDTKIEDSKEACEKLTKLFKSCEWESTPKLSVELLELLKKEDDNATHDVEVCVYDKDGNRAYLEYGDNGYITTGFRFDSSCNHGDIQCYPIFKKAIEKLNGELISCDGGNVEYYKEWESEQND